MRGREHQVPTPPHSWRALWKNTSPEGKLGWILGLFVSMGCVVFLANFEAFTDPRFGIPKPRVQEIKLPSTYLCFDERTIETTQVKHHELCPDGTYWVEVKRYLVQ